MVLSFAILFVCFHFAEKKNIKKSNNSVLTDNINLIKEDESQAKITFHQEAKNLNIDTDSLSGTISTMGLKFNSVTLKKYKENIHEETKVRLFNDSDQDNLYYAEFGWKSKDKDTIVPNKNTLWNLNKDAINQNETATFTWTSPQNVTFIVHITVDNSYMFNVEQIVQNNSDKNIEIIPYGRIAKTYNTKHKTNSMLHEGALLVENNVLNEYKYEKLNKGNKIMINNFNAKSNKRGWFGITDKYWVSALIPNNDYSTSVRIKSHSIDKNHSQINADFITNPIIVEKDLQKELSTNLFVGAKDLNILDAYNKVQNISLFDRAVDFGMLYFITKPIFLFLQQINKQVGNFGFSIIILTIIIRLLLFPLANKSYRSMSKMKKIQPEIQTIKNKYADNRVLLNQETIKLFQKHKINPMLGCLPLLLQIPIFFALYKVLFVTIEMRHASFIWWIEDLSAPDTVGIMTLAKMLNITLPNFLQIGVWPIILSIVIAIQQKTSPTSYDKQQEAIIKLLPFILIFMFASLPVGLIIYWTCSNILSIIQQVMINKTVNQTKMC